MSVATGEAEASSRMENIMSTVQQALKVILSRVTGGFITRVFERGAPLAEEGVVDLSTRPLEQRWTNYMLGTPEGHKDPTVSYDENITALAWYSRMWGIIENMFRKYGIRPRSVADIGCGPGVHLPTFQRMFFLDGEDGSVSVLGADCSQHVLKQYEAMAQTLPGIEVTTVQANVGRDRGFLGTHRFEVIFASLILPYLDNREKDYLVGEMHEALEEGGYLVYTSQNVDFSVERVKRMNYGTGLWIERRAALHRRYARHAKESLDKGMVPTHYEEREVEIARLKNAGFTVMEEEFIWVDHGWRWPLVPFFPSLRRHGTVLGSVILCNKMPDPKQ